MKAALFAWPLLMPLLATAGCAGAGGGAWPSLAMRAGEAPPLVPRPVSAGAGLAGASTPTVAPPAAATTGAVGDANDGQGAVAARDADARLASIERDTKAYAARLSAQLAATARAAAAARGGAAGGEMAAAGELELSRLDRLGGQGADLRDRLDALAGDLARTGGGATLTAVGAAIERVEGLRAQQAKGFAAARAQLPR